MKKITAWAKGHKIAAVFIGAGSLVVVGFVFIIALGLILVGSGVVEPEVEPTAQVAKAEPEAEKKPETKAPEKTKAPEPKKTQEPKKAEAAKTKTPKVAEPKSEPKAESAKPKQDARIAPLNKKLKGIEKKLSVFYEECEWENSVRDEVSIKAAQGACDHESIGIIVTEADHTAQIIIDRLAENNPNGQYFINDGVAVWSPNPSGINMPWDVLGAEGTPTSMSE